MDPQDKARLDREFSELYRAHLRDVYSYAYYRVGNHHDAEDLTEQTFLQAYRHFERAQAESDGRPLRPWLIRIAHNLAANLYRDRSRKPQTPIDDTTVLRTMHTTEDLVEGRDELARILEGVKELPDDRREALIMRFALGMDNREIARAMGKTDGATKVLLHRAIKQLEEIVTRVMSDDRHRSTSRRCCARRCARSSRPTPVERAWSRRCSELTDAGRRRARALGARRDARPAQLGAARSSRRRAGTTAGTALVVLRVRASATQARGGVERPARPGRAHGEGRRRRGAQAASTD